MNEYKIAIVCGAVILVCWCVAYVFCWISQYAWAWIDDSEAPSENWIASKINFSAYRYPLHNEFGRGLADAIEKKQKPFGYSRNKKDKNKEWLSVSECDKRYGFQTYAGILPVSALTSLIPFFAVLSFNFYPLTLSVMLILSLIYIARMVVRGKKLFNKHVKDKDAHKG